MRYAIFAVLFALGGCQQPTQDPTQLAGRCAASATSQWDIAGEQALEISGVAEGGDCANANVTITIRKATGDTLVSASYPLSQVMTFAGASSQADVQRMLGEWIAPDSAMNSTGDLPTWNSQDETPMNGEFPFFVEEGATRASYAALRELDAPMFCYVQGMESLSCLAWRDGGLASVGLQTFPG